MWKDKIRDVENRMNVFGDKMNTGASLYQIGIFCDEIFKRFQIVVPNEFLEFLNYMNGVEFNGHIIYGIDEEYVSGEHSNDIIGFIDLNETWYDNEELKKYLFMGESDNSWYAWLIETESYLELDKPSGTPVKHFSGCKEMIAFILKSSL